MKFAIWYDNGTGWYEASGLFDASGPKEALENNSSGVRWSADVVVTAGYDQNPNENKDYVLERL